MVKRKIEPPRKCDIGGCCEPGLYVFKKYMVCPYHFSAYIDDVMDLDVYFSLLESKVIGVMLKEEDADDSDDYDLGTISACLDFVRDSEEEEIIEEMGEGGPCA